MKFKNFLFTIVSVTFLVFIIFIVSLFFDTKEIIEGDHLINMDNEVYQAVDNYMKEMTLEEKVGQLFIVGFPGKSLTANTKEFLSTYKIGGVLLLGYNLGNDQAIINLNNDLQKVHKEYSDYPMFISVDQEGGVVSRLSNVNSVAQKKIVNVEQAQSVAKDRGLALHKLGFNVNYSPVLDFINNSDSFLFDRTFSGNLEIRGDLALAMMEGYKDTQIIPVPKHFPGHPDNKVDSHQELPNSNISQEKILYKAQNFKETLSQAPFMMLMTGHVLYYEVDDIYPASLSSKFINDILRKDWSYQGVVITDDLEMGALQNNFTNKEIAKQAFLAGNDLLLYSGTKNRVVEAYTVILEAVKAGGISKERLDNSVKRILILKYYLQ